MFEIILYCNCGEIAIWREFVTLEAAQEAEAFFRKEHTGASCEVSGVSAQPHDPDADPPYKSASSLTPDAQYAIRKAIRDLEQASEASKQRRVHQLVK